MSKRLLYYLNGGKRGEFFELIKNLGEKPVIYWYPSAGRDFFPIFTNRFETHGDYIRENYPELKEPEIYLMSDYHFSEWNTQVLKVGDYKDYPRFRILYVEELRSFPDAKYPENLVDFIKKEENRPITFYIKILDKEREKIYHYVYSFVENAWFISKVLLRQRAEIKYVLRKIFGGGFAGGRARGEYLKNVLYFLKTKVFMGEMFEGTYNIGDEISLELYPEIRERGKRFEPEFIEDENLHDGTRWYYVKFPYLRR